jgi:SAM-dependent methyltransferase
MGTADIYDEHTTTPSTTLATVQFLAELAGAGRALELGIGTGRLALPLTARGVEVVGIDASLKMIEKLRAKPGGGDLQVVMGDFADVAAPGNYNLVYVAFNTFFALLSQADQIRCLCNVAAKLEPGGHFVLDCFVPDLTRFDHHQATKTMRVAQDRVELDTATHDPVNQRVDTTHVVLTPTGTELYPISLRYVWPAELDVMAMQAGLALETRFAGYDRRQFDRDSGMHVSVYRRSGALTA